ncbi:hypothetical protein [Methylobacterium sp. Leaf118]|uniref:hypothetical protein n=1 Tax=Methylobacterium sp. Leaf118 TaxID=2876562 RepID=UPI001E3F1F39|nr:hypothetical protein [Methylobacterium sp. Leaf118]
MWKQELCKQSSSLNDFQPEKVQAIKRLSGQQELNQDKATEIIIITISISIHAHVASWRQALASAVSL